VARPAPGSGGGRLVLVADDNHDLVAALTLALRRWGYRTLTAFDGSTALAVALFDRPAVIFLDLCLPGLDACEVARSVRAHPRLRRTVVIALSGTGDPDVAARALAAGCCRFVRKPVDPSELRRALEDAVPAGLGPGGEDD
jgi:CheY-like chemotaxis protein